MKFKNHLEQMLKMKIVWLRDIEDGLEGSKAYFFILGETHIEV